MKYTPAFLRHYPHLRPKTASFAALLRVRSQLIAATHAFFAQRKFVNITTPAITTNDCEGGGETFRVTSRRKPGRDLAEAVAAVEAVEAEEAPTQAEAETLAAEERRDRGDPSEFFTRPTFLSTSGQLHLEVAAGALKNVYTLSPAFRAEATIRRLHMAEFLMLEVESAFLDSYEPLLSLTEEFLRQAADGLLRDCPEDLAILDRYHHDDAKAQRLAKFRAKLERENFPRITFAEARRLLSGRKDFVYAIDDDLKKEHEWALVNEVGEGGPVWVTDFPAHSKPFYAARSQCGEWAKAFDLLVPMVGELVSGSVREPSWESLRSRMQSLGGLDEEMGWYLDLRLGGHAPTAGFGLGLDRCIQCLLGIANAKDCLPFPLSYQQPPLPSKPLLQPPAS